MSKQKLIIALTKASALLINHAPEILSGLAVVGVGATVILTGDGTIKACKIIEEEKKEKINRIADDQPETLTEVDLTKKEILLATWKCFVPAAASAAFTITCIVLSHRQSAKKIAALAGLYSISEGNLEEYKKKTKELLGEKKADQIAQSVADAKLESNPVQDTMVIDTGRGTMLCFDCLSGRYFRGSYEFIRQAANSFNEVLYSGEYCLSLNEFYSYLDLDSIGLGEEIGWTASRPLKLDLKSRLASNGEPCIVLDYETRPSPNFHDF